MRALTRVLAGFLAAVCALAAATSPQVTLQLRDFVEFPITGNFDGTGQTDGMLARINSLREEPGGGTRFFVNDLNGPLYIVDKAAKRITTYLDFNGREGHHGLFRRLSYEAGYANGLNSFQFDPDYRSNGRFYTVHIEDPSLPGSAVPDNTAYPALNLAGYTTTPPIPTPGPIQREGVLIEWTDTDTSNTTFEGSAREIMRLEYTGRIHPMGDLAFNPTARPNDVDWRVLYLATGDGGNGEQKSDVRSNPQRSVASAASTRITGTIAPLSEFSSPGAREEARKLLSCGLEMRLHV